VTVRFSDHFGLNRSQAELDFVDIPLDTDVPLFVDPYAISLEHDPWFIECNNLIVGFFQLVVDSIVRDETDRARRLLAYLREPNETHLGLSSGRPRGNGVGSDQAGQIYERLARSRAVRTGTLRDLADAELVIPGISHDKISDITTNIIRRPLIAYTEAQCDLFGIPTRQVPSGVYWDGEREAWRNAYVRLPLYRRRRIVLVPKTAVRYQLSVDHQEYYRHFVLEYLQTEHLDAGSSLVRTLKNGKRRVYKKDLEEQYPLSKEFLAEFTEQHPEVLERYKDSLPEKTAPLENESIEHRQPDPREIDVGALIGVLGSIEPGHFDASRYHNFVLDALTAIFYPALRDGRKEQEIHEGRKRIDIAFTNRAQTGFFYALNLIHRVRCPYIFFECKNYSRDPNNPEFDQLTGRFSPNRGKFGIAVCRSITDRDTMLSRCRDVIHDDRGYILVFDDSDIEKLLRLRAEGEQEGIDDYLDGCFRQLVM
jgi:hypothetical protein